MSSREDLARCLASTVVDSAINEPLTTMNRRVFNAGAEPYDEDWVARNFGSEALDHFRAIRHHRDALKAIIQRPKEAT